MCSLAKDRPTSIPSTLSDCLARRQATAQEDEATVHLELDALEVLLAARQFGQVIPLRPTAEIGIKALIGTRLKVHAGDCPLPGLKRSQHHKTANEDQVQDSHDRSISPPEEIPRQ